MSKRCTGFTLIELMAVIVILGVLAATAIPRFVNLNDAAKQAAVDGIAGAIESGASLNHARNIANDAGLTSDEPIAVSSCDDATKLLEGGLNSDYVVSQGSGTVVANEGVSNEGGISLCLVSYDTNGNGAFDVTDLPKAEFSLYGVQ